ncbi:uncharacterized protein B0T23DRAFT_407877 [Neurospora hispaniola]|uniref:J domain-containing protein n=1 Tax=Neurospora hispaniola TaxID=588809 RepID=A0AAJ0MMC7_9PEZI|nr:hypothetical protein B0T23DRAFT_407877 [Neurospora hispaniola]
MVVKLDYDRDYYADLELSSTADVVEVKKQFKKLALKYHPDRNPGKEDEAKDRFIHIQAAHEVLTDVSMKAKYDAYRKRASASVSRYATASGHRGNPYSNVSAEMADRYGAPPTRRTPHMPSRPDPGPSAHARYSSWATPSSSSSSRPVPPKTASAADNLRAWDAMRSSAKTGQTSSSTPKSSGYASARTERTERTESARREPPPVPPRTAGQARRADAAFGTTRRAGYSPDSPVGDEPPVSRHNYTSSAHYTATTNMFEDTAANIRKSRPQSSPTPVDPLSEKFSETYLDSRQRTPYASHIGEKFNPFEGANVNRAKSMKDPSRPTQESEEEAPPPRSSRQRSASVGESNSFGKAANGGTTCSGTSKAEPRASARYYAQEAEPRSAPNTEANPTPRASTSSMRSNSNAQAPTSESAQQDGPKVYAPSPFFKPDEYFQQTSSFGQPSKIRPPHVFSRAGAGSYRGRAHEETANNRASHGRNTPSGDQSTSGDKSLFEKDMHDQLQLLLGRRKMHSRRQHIKPIDDPLSPRKTNAHNRVQKQRATNSVYPHSFAVPDDDGYTPKPQASADFTRSGVHNINASFVDQEKVGAGFQFNAGGPTTIPGADAFLRAKQRARSVPRGRQSPLKKTYTSSNESVSGATRPPSETNDAGKKASAFDAGQWQAEFGPHTFVPPPPAKKSSTSPTRNVRPIRKPRPVKMTAGTAGLVDEEETSSSEGKSRSNSAAGVDESGINGGAPSPMAMDIDEPPPPPTPAHAVPPAAPPPTPAHGIPTIINLNGGSARNVNLEPSKPEWRAGNLNNNNNGVKTSNGGTSSRRSSSAANATHRPIPVPNAGSEDSDLRPIFGNFDVDKLVSPSGTGLSSFSADLKTNLPFESRASTTLPPFEREKIKPKNINFPTPPKAPSPPAALATPSQVTPSQWALYAEQFKLYIHQFNTFNGRVVDHFAARKIKNEQKGPAWVTQLGDKEMLEYLAWMEEDKTVMQKWAQAREAHELNVMEFARWKERTKTGLGTSGRMTSEEWAKDFWSQGVKKGSWREWKMRFENEGEIFWVRHGEVIKKVTSQTIMTAMVYEALLRLGLFSQIGETVLNLIMGAVVVLISGSAAWFLSKFAVDDEDENGTELLGEHDHNHGQQRQYEYQNDESRQGMSDIEEEEEDADDEDQTEPEPPSSSALSESSSSIEEDYEGSDYVFEYESDYSDYQPRRQRSRSRSHQEVDIEVEYLSSFSLDEAEGYSYGGGEDGGPGGPRYGQEGGEGYISSWSERGESD